MIPGQHTHALNEEDASRVLVYSQARVEDRPECVRDEPLRSVDPVSEGSAHHHFVKLLGATCGITRRLVITFASMHARKRWKHGEVRANVRMREDLGVLRLRCALAPECESERAHGCRNDGSLGSGTDGPFPPALGRRAAPRACCAEVVECQVAGERLREIGGRKYEGHGRRGREWSADSAGTSSVPALLSTAPHPAAVQSQMRSFHARLTAISGRVLDGNCADIRRKACIQLIDTPGPCPNSVQSTTYAMAASQQIRSACLAGA